VKALTGWWGPFAFGVIMKCALLIDGGYLRACAKGAQKVYDNEFIVSFSNICFSNEEYKLRILYYDAPQYKGKVALPVSGNETEFKSSDQWLRDLAKNERFAVRRGTIGFRGWKPKTLPIVGKNLSDADFAPVFEQKGVDMRIGLDIANFSERKTVDRIIIISGDTDMLPAMKQARKSGIEVVIIQLPPPSRNLHDTLLAHSDLVRKIEKWP
jgi:uncharacterized LabA/DUF88 family protein